MFSESKNKLLVVCSWAPPVIGAPQNLYNLLSSLQKDSYNILTRYHCIDSFSAKNGTWLEGKYIFYDNPKFTDSPETRILVSIESKEEKTVSKLRRLIRRFSFLKVIFGPALIFSQIFMIVRQGLKSIKEEKIEIMLAVSDFGPALISTYLLYKVSKKPYILYLFDLYKGNYFFFPGRLLATIFEKTLFKNAKKVIVINDGTKEFYIKRYGENYSGKIEVIYNSVFPESYLQLQKTQPFHNNPKSPYTIIFTGTIYWPQIDALKNMIKAVNEINNLEIKLKIYSPSPRDYLKEMGIEESDKIEISVAPPQKMPEIQSKADILFLPLSWHTKSPQIIATTTPSKLSDYLIAGRPILIHAPQQTTLVQYAKTNKFAMVVDEENIETLKAAVKKLLTDEKLTNQLVINARKTFFKDHDANRNNLRFKAILDLKLN